MPLRVSVVGAGEADASELDRARRLGKALAEADAIVVTGGGGGVMAAASEGAAAAGGTTLGLLQGPGAGEANPWVAIPLPTGMGQGRNVLVVRAGEAVVAVGGSWGTLSEIALARKLGREVLLLGGGPFAHADLVRVSNPVEAARLAVEAAQAFRAGSGPSR